MISHMISSRQEGGIMTKFDTKKEKFFKTPIPKDISVDDVKYLAGRYKCDWKEGANHSRVIFDPEKYPDCPIPYTSIQVPRHPGPSNQLISHN